FLAVDGTHQASIEDNTINLGMIDVSEYQMDGQDLVLNTGSPHYVKFVQDLAHRDVYQEGYNIRNNETYREKGINVNFIEQEGEGYFVRTFARGVEDETFACGTGAVASGESLIFNSSFKCSNKIPFTFLFNKVDIDSFFAVGF